MCIRDRRRVIGKGHGSADLLSGLDTRDNRLVRIYSRRPIKPDVCENILIAAPLNKDARASRYIDSLSREGNASSLIIYAIT